MTDTANATTPDAADVGLTTERRGEGLLLRLDRPKRRNALTVGLVRALATAVEGAPVGGQLEVEDVDVLRDAAGLGHFGMMERPCWRP